MSRDPAVFSFIALVAHGSLQTYLVNLVEALKLYLGGMLSFHLSPVSFEKE